MQSKRRKEQELGRNELSPQQAAGYHVGFAKKCFAAFISAASSGVFCRRFDKTQNKSRKASFLPASLTISAFRFFPTTPVLSVLSVLSVSPCEYRHASDIRARVKSRVWPGWATVPHPATFRLKPSPRLRT